MSFTDAVTQLTEAPGSLIYHIALTMSLIVLFSVAQAFKRSVTEPEATRWIFASSSLLVLRLLILIVDGVSWLDLFNGQTLLPTFDRFASLTGVLVFAWIFDLPLPKYSKYLLIFGSLFNLVVIFLLPNILLGQDATEPFNHTTIDALWSFSSLILVVAATITLLTVRPLGWSHAIWSFGLLTLGMLLHISQGPPTASTAGYVHVAEIAVYPLFTIGAIRTMAGSRASTFVGTKGSPDSLPSFEELAFLEVATDLATSSFSDEETQFERQAVEMISRGLKIDLTMLLSVDRGVDKVELISGFDLSQKRPLPISTFDSQLFPELSRALREGNYHQVQPKSRKSELFAMDSVVGRKVEDSLHLFPLRAGREVMGGLLTSSPKSHPLASPVNQAKMREVVSILANRIKNWRGGVAPDELLDYAHQDEAQFQIQQLEEEKYQLEQALLSLQQKANAAELARVDEGYHTERANQEEIQQLEAEVVRLTSALAYKENTPTDEQVEQLTSERQIALEELASARSALAMMEKMIERGNPEDDLLSADPGALTTIAQELRRPMSAIQVYSELLLNETAGVLGTVQESFLLRIRNASEKVGSLLNELSKVNPADIAQLQIQRKQVALTECLDAAVNMIRAKMQERKITLKIELLDELPALLADEDTVIQILYRMLSQAMSVSPMGGQIELLIGEKEAEGMKFLTVLVRDSGEKISPETLKQIVQMEEQGEMITSGTEPHLLALKKLITMMDGRIWFDHQEETGNTFTILLPVLNEPVPA